LGRLIQTDTAGKDRTRLTKAMVLAIRGMMTQSSFDQASKDLAAYLVLALEATARTIEPSVAAWEKRGYWVKADRFRMEWQWCEPAARALRKALAEEDWLSVAQVSATVAQRLGNVKVAANHRMGAPWLGAWEKLVMEERKAHHGHS
jgi:hypothetical protein